MDSEKWGIVGGGIMGMTLAHRLANEGKNVTVFEAASEVGGLASSWKMGEVEWDKFYHVILLSDFRTRKILEEIGLDKEINWVETKTGFYMNENLYSMSDTIEFLKFPTLNLIDKFRLGLTIIIASRIKNWKRLEKIPVTEWLRRWSGKKTFNKIWLPLLRAKLGQSYKKTSAVFIWATIQRLYGARRSGLKKEMFGYVSGGYKKIISAFKDLLISEGVSIKTDHTANQVKKLQNAKIEIAFKSGFTEQFDKVIVTLPSGIAAKLCYQLKESEIEKLQNIEYLGVVCVSVLLNKPVSDFYITNITDSWIPFTGVIEMSALVDKKYFNGQSLIYLPKYVTADDEIYQKSDEEIKESFLEIFTKMYPWIDLENIKFAGVARARNVITVAKLDYKENLPGIKTTIPNLFIVNTSHIKDGTLNVNETIRVAETKLEEILEKS